VIENKNGRQRWCESKHLWRLGPGRGSTIRPWTPDGPDAAHPGRRCTFLSGADRKRPGPLAKTATARRGAAIKLLRGGRSGGGGMGGSMPRSIRGKRNDVPMISTTGNTDHAGVGRGILKACEVCYWGQAPICPNTGLTVCVSRLPGRPDASHPGETCTKHCVPRSGLPDFRTMATSFLGANRGGVLLLSMAVLTVGEGVKAIRTKTRG